MIKKEDDIISPNSHRHRVCLFVIYRGLQKHSFHCLVASAHHNTEHLKTAFSVISARCDLKVLLVWTFGEWFWNGFPDVQS